MFVLKQLRTHVLKKAFPFYFGNVTYLHCFVVNNTTLTAVAVFFVQPTEMMSIVMISL